MHNRLDSIFNIAQPEATGSSYPKDLANTILHHAANNLTAYPTQPHIPALSSHATRPSLLRISVPMKQSSASSQAERT
jgi:hypothetical protein